jgi:hypothetical protein
VAAAKLALFSPAYSRRVQHIELTMKGKEELGWNGKWTFASRHIFIFMVVFLYTLMAVDWLGSD